MTNKEKLVLLLAVTGVGQDEYGKHFESPVTREELTSLTMKIFEVSHESSDEDLNKYEDDVKDTLTKIANELYEELKGELS